MTTKVLLHAALMYDPATIANSDKAAEGYYQIILKEPGTHNDLLGAALDGLHSQVDIADPSAFEFSLYDHCGQPIKSERKTPPGSLSAAVLQVNQLSSKCVADFFQEAQEQAEYDENLRQKTIAVACSNANGEADIFICEVASTPEQRDNGEHYERAIEQAEADDYEGPFVCFDHSEQARIKAAATELKTPSQKLTTWENNAYQFPRLLSEIRATVDISPENWDALCESMDLDRTEIDRLFDRAETAFEEAKTAVQR